MAPFNFSLRDRGRPCLAYAALIGVSVVACACSPADSRVLPVASVTVFEGARLIVGDGSAPIADAGFIVEEGRFTQVGPRGRLQVPAGASRVDLTGKTVMPPIAGGAGGHAAGVLAAGKSADFMVVSANPLEDISKTGRIGILYRAGAAVDRMTLPANTVQGVK